MRDCNCSFMIGKGSFMEWEVRPELWINSISFKYQSNTLYIRNSWLQVLFWKIPCPLRNGWPQLLSWQRNTVPWKKLFPATKRSNLRGKSYSLGTTTLDHSLFNKLLFAAVCYFSVYKLIGWDPENIYLSTVNNRNTRKKKWIVPKINNKYNRKSFWCLFCQVFELLTLNR